MSTILDRILEHKRLDVVERRNKRSHASLLADCRSQPATRGFTRALVENTTRGHAAVIAEIKRASPSKGLIRADFDPPSLALSYARGGATCLSVLTDIQFFQGADSYLQTARAAVTLPVLRKDFVVDRYQLAESRVLGADCVLLIVSALPSTQLSEFHLEARELGLDTLIEVHDQGELEQALTLSPQLIGVNNRNLRTFEVSLDISLALKRMLPDGTTLVSESGINTRNDVRTLPDAGINCFLVGEAFMRADDPGSKLRELFYQP